MSGIAGIYRTDGEHISPDIIQGMLGRIAHRGPDESGTWHEGTVALGHCMLRTTPESFNERLPLASANHTVVLTADARIDNRDELASALALDAEGVGDSSFILAAYERWGDACVEHLLGDFAFALWDGERRVLFCARDHMGIKPFYYYCSREIFAFASEMKALWALPCVPKDVNEEQIAYHLAEHYVDRAITSYAGITRLPAAHALTVHANGAELRQYWALDPTVKLHLDSDAAYEAAFRDVFAAAVRCRLRSAYTLGAELSGGVDSSSVVGTARHLLRCSAEHGPLHTFSHVYENLPECDERSFIEPVVAEGGLVPHYVYADKLSPYAHVDEMLWHTEESFSVSANLFPYWDLFYTAHDCGIRVLLDGEGGDEVMGLGEGIILDLVRQGKWGTAVRELRAANAHSDLSSPMHFYLLSPVVRELTPRVLSRLWRRVKKPQFAKLRYNFVRCDLAKRVGLVDELSKRVEKPRPQPAHAPTHEAIPPRTQYFFEHKDKAAAAFSLEVRHPFWDRRVVEFCNALPPEQLFRHGYIKWIVRRALAACLPREVRCRYTKASPDANINRGLLNDKDRIEDALFARVSRVASYIDVDALRRAYPAFVKGEHGGLVRTWKAFALARWLQRCIPDDASP